MGEAGMTETDVFRPPTERIERVAVTDAHRRRLGGPFAHDRFLLRQRHLSWNESYEVSSAHGEDLLRVQRPSGFVASLVVAMISGLLFLAIGGATIFWGLELGIERESTLVVMVAGLLAASGAAMTVARLFGGRRDVAIRSLEGDRLLIAVHQDEKVQLVRGRFTITDEAQQPIAVLRKNYLVNFLRRTWRCHAPDGDLLCIALEDHIVLALLRRLFGHLFGLLRVNYIVIGADGRLIGRFERRLPRLDRFVLDLTPDIDGTLDRRVGLALGVMLDTGERR
jgi:uncharacterized protein YxjI